MDVRQGFTVEHTVDPQEALDFAEANHFDFIELNMEYTFARNRLNVDKLGSLFNDSSLDIIVHLPYRLDPASPHNHVRDGACRELEAAIETASTVGANKGIFHATTQASSERWGNQKLRECLYSSIQRIIEYSQKLNFTACLENIKDNFFDAGDFPEVFQRTSVSGCLDTGHAYATGVDGSSQANLIRNHGDSISHIHLNDTRKDSTDEHLPVGFGKIDFAAIVKAMVEVDWEGTCTHEIYAYDLESRKLGKRTFNCLLRSI